MDYQLLSQAARLLPLNLASCPWWVGLQVGLCQARSTGRPGGQAALGRHAVLLP